MFKLKILSAEKSYFEGEVKALIVPGVIGDMEILSHHAPILSLLKKGTLTYRDAANAAHTMEIVNGLLEVSNHNATVLL